MLRDEYFLKMSLKKNVILKVRISVVKTMAIFLQFCKISGYFWYINCHFSVENTSFSSDVLKEVQYEAEF